MRWFFISVTIPRMMYTTDLFLVPGSKISKGTKGFIGKLAKIQRQVTLHITGALISAPTDVIDTCADMLLFHLLVERLMHRAVTRLATLPGSNPLVKHMAHTVNRYVKSHWAPLQEVMHAFKVRPANFESINPCTCGPKDTLNFTFHMPDSKEEAKLEAVANRSKVTVFLDRSGHEGGIGVVAVLYRVGKRRTR